MYILGIETSCDETAAAVVEGGHLVLSDVVATQIEVHSRYGGVVPELASRNHIVDIIPVVQQALEQAGLQPEDLDAIAVTQGPGLLGSLLVGLQFAKSLAYAWDKPLIPIHHLAGHLHAVQLHLPESPQPEAPAPPYLALAVSGGHTALYRVDKQLHQIANTRDDAAGEAFDKVARMLGLGYPGGPVIERLAQQGDPQAHRFSLPRFKDGSSDFSFSGLKTAVLTLLKKQGELPKGQALHDLLASFQAAAIAQLVDRSLRALKSQGLQDLVLAGGVACNAALRESMREALRAEGCRLYLPPPRWCTDNAAMIAGVASLYAQEGQHQPADRRLKSRGSWPLELR